MRMKKAYLLLATIIIAIMFAVGCKENTNESSDLNANSARESEAAPDEKSTDDMPIELTLNKTARTKDFEFTVLKYEIAEKIYPGYSRGEKGFFGADPTKETLLAVRVTMKNTTDKDIDPKELFDVVALFNDNEYSGFLSGDDEGGFNGFVYLPAGVSEQLVFVIQVPIEVKSSKQPLEVKFKMNTGDELVFKITA